MSEALSIWLIALFLGVCVLVLIRKRASTSDGAGLLFALFALAFLGFFVLLLVGFGAALDALHQVAQPCGPSRAGLRSVTSA